MPVAFSVALTVAPGTSAPDGSVTVPLMAPRNVWACAFSPLSTKTRATAQRPRAMAGATVDVCELPLGVWVSAQNLIMSSSFGSLSEGAKSVYSDSRDYGGRPFNLQPLAGAGPSTAPKNMHHTPRPRRCLGLSIYKSLVNRELN